MEGEEMKRKLSILLCGTLAAGMLTACGGKKEMTGSEINAKSTGEEETVTIWHDGDEAIMGVIEDTVNKKIADENVSIKFEKKLNNFFAFFIVKVLEISKNNSKFAKK